MAELIKPTRRGLITGLIALVAAPAIVKASSLMPINLGLTQSLEPIVAGGFLHGDQVPDVEFTDASILREGILYIHEPDGKCYMVGHVRDFRFTPA